MKPYKKIYTVKTNGGIYRIQWMYFYKFLWLSWEKQGWVLESCGLKIFQTVDRAFAFNLRNDHNKDENPKKDYRLWEDA